MWPKVWNVLARQWPMHLIMLITGVFPDTEPILRLRGFLLKPFFKRTGRNFQVCSGVYVTHSDRVEIGDNVFLARSVWIGGGGGVILQDNVMLGPFVAVASSNHVRGSNGSLRFGGHEGATVVIGQDAWCGSHVTITPGVSIPPGSIVGAGTVVTKSFEEPGSFIAGVPGKYLGQAK